MNFCSNCDVASAVYKCQQCPQAESEFCEACMKLHTKVKAYRDHSFELIRKELVLCGNCEESEAKFVCRQCGDSCKYLCVGCSVMHPKIKAFRGHQVVSTQSTTANANHFEFQFPTSLDHLSDLVAKAIDTVYYNLISSSWKDKLFWKTIGAVLLVTLLYYSIVRIIFTKYSSLVNMATGIGLYQWFQSTKFRVPDSEKKLITGKADPVTRASAVSQSMFSPTAGISLCGNSRSGGSSSFNSGGKTPRGWNVSLDQFDKNEFKDEFWYSTEDKKASLRPRGRPYRRNPTNANESIAAGATNKSNSTSASNNGVSGTESCSGGASLT